MEYTFSELKKKMVVNVQDGKKMGKISDLTFCFPGAKIISFTVSPSMNVFCGEQAVITPFDIEKIGEDTILVNQKKFCEKKDDDYGE